MSSPIRPRPLARTRGSSALAAAAALLLLAAGCATSGALREGQQAEDLQDYDHAVVAYSKALKEHPDDRSVRLALERAKMRASQDHFTRGRRFSETGKYEQALLELQIAAE